MKANKPKIKTKAAKKAAGPKCRWPSAGCLAAIRQHRRAGRERPVMMISSSVFGIEPLLNQIEGVLKSVGWDVYMSKAGTFSVTSDHSAMGNCINAVDDCDAFLGIITGRYGSGKDKHGISFTHREMERAIKLERKRWFLAQHEVVVSRSLFKAMDKASPGLRATIEKGDALRGNPYLDNWRIIDQYNMAIKDGLGHLEDRLGNWVQPYRTDDEAMLYVRNQLLNPLHLFPQYIPKIVKGAIR